MTEIELAVVAFDSFGSTRYRDEAERELRKLGRSTPRRSKPGKSNGTGVATLSERELQVGRLVVDRKTNPEIAAELFLSLKTVESHMRNIFRKLDVHSRVEVARSIERADRTGDGSSQGSQSIAAAASAERLTAERDRLQAEVRAKIDELRSSRARIVEAGDTERRRLERNLHDGAQQRLVSLSLSLSLMERQLESPDQAAAVAALRSELTEALDELRELARGLHPAILVDHGLEASARGARRTGEHPGRARHRNRGAAIGPDRGGNLLRRLRSTHERPEVRPSIDSPESAFSPADDEVVLEVIDDGVGGADITQGSGLQGLADRVEALGGSIAIASPTGGGTSLCARIPLERNHG